MLIKNLANIKDITFKKSKIGGYKPFEVDEFIDDVYDFCEAIQKDNDELIEKVRNLEHQLEKYQEEESSIRKAVLGAQKFADASMADADYKSKNIIFNASQKADKIVREAREEVEKQKKIAWNINIESEKFRNKLMKMYEDRLQELRSEIEENEFFKENEEEIREQVNLISPEENCEKKNVLEVEFSKQKETDKDEISPQEDKCKAETAKDMDFEICKVKRDLGSLRFGAKYRVSSQEFGKGICSGFFRRKNNMKEKH